MKEQKKRKMKPYTKKPNILKEDWHDNQGGKWSGRTQTKKDQVKAANRAQKKAVRQIAKKELKSYDY